MSDEKLRAALRSARENGEWTPYLAEAQRAGVSFEEVLRESAGAAIPLINSQPDALHTFAKRANQQAMLWLSAAEDIAEHDPVILISTYAALGIKSGLPIPQGLQGAQILRQAAVCAEQNNHQEYADQIAGEDTDAFELMARAAAEIRNYDRASALIKKCQKSPSLYLSIAQAAAENKDYEEAKNFAEQVRPKEQAYVELVNIAGANGDLEQAVKFSESTGHSIREARIYLAGVHSYCKNHALADENAKNSSDIEKAHALMAQARAKRKDYRKAGRIANRIKLTDSKRIAKSKIAIAAAENKNYNQAQAFLPSIHEGPQLFDLTVCAIANEAAKNRDYNHLPFFVPANRHNLIMTLGCIANAQLKNGDLELAVQTAQSITESEARAISYCDFARIIRGAR